MEIGEQIKKLRTDAGWSQQELADKLCVTRQAITKWESKKGIPDINNLKNIADLFEISVDTLLGHEAVDSDVAIEEIDYEKYKAAFKASGIKKRHCGGTCGYIIRDKYPAATTVYALARNKKLSRLEWWLDFIEPGFLAMVDSLKDTGAYFLVENNNRQLLVRIKNNIIEQKELQKRVPDEKTFVLDGNKFYKMFKLEY